MHGTQWQVLWEGCTLLTGCLAMGAYMRASKRAHARTRTQRNARILSRREEQEEGCQHTEQGQEAIRKRQHLHVSESACGCPVLTHE